MGNHLVTAGINVCVPEEGKLTKVDMPLDKETKLNGFEMSLFILNVSQTLLLFLDLLR